MGRAIRKVGVSWRNLLFIRQPKMRSFTTVFLLATFLAAQVLGYPQQGLLRPGAPVVDEFLPLGVQVEPGFKRRSDDLDIAADSVYAAPHVPLGRMKIQVYRGPNVPHKDAYGHEEYFAPWGYYNTQPLDLPAYH